MPLLSVPSTRPVRVQRIHRAVLAVALLTAACNGDSSSPATSAAPDTTAPATTAPPPSTTEQGETGPALDQVSAVLGALFAAADHSFETNEDGTVSVFGTVEGGGEPFLVSTISADGHSAADDGVVLTSPGGGETTSSAIRIAGEGRGFEAVLDVAAVSPAGQILGRTFTTGGALEELLPIDAWVGAPRGYRGPIYVVVSSSQGADDVLPELGFVLLDVIEDPEETARVVDVASDDVLNVRIEPDPEAFVVGTLAPFAENVSVVDRSPDADGWWLVVAGNGAIGWSNSAFLELMN